MVSSSTLAVTACGNTGVVTGFYETDYNKAFSLAFYNEDGNFEMLPNLNKKENTTDNIEINDLLKSDGINLKIDCEKYECVSKNSFKGKSILKTQYKEQDHETQYAFDDLAQWFLISPESNQDVFYDYSSLEMNLNHSSTNYYFNNKKEGDELILWSQQNSMIIKDNSKTLENIFLMFDSDIKLDLNTLTYFLGANSNSKIEKNTLNLIFEVDKESEIDEEIFKVQNFFEHYQSDLNFSKKEEGNKFESNNLKNFLMGNDLIENITIEFTIDGDRGVE
ncbi:hypothetical protein SMONO_v1c03990 [Spiroplasma monobiae MQ-1]|uniref:Uncharacterized protein n=2 Tax=Spiroplasma monobiae (strain ATCC 33825 / MQ-1) TaxID=2136 RepID=A0A2K9LUB3_SPISQ|nr:hypothetical protein SMONO_v1c03990 [Spiroplasma monobiae MQ-1]